MGEWGPAWEFYFWVPHIAEISRNSEVSAARHVTASPVVLQIIVLMNRRLFKDTWTNTQPILSFLPGTLGVSGLVTRNDCEAMRNVSYHVDSIATWAQDCEKSTGLVTTTRVTHATPAALYAHTANRDWESDKHVLKAKLDPRECEDIASQLITRSPGNKLNVSKMLCCITEYEMLPATGTRVLWFHQLLIFYLSHRS